MNPAIAIDHDILRLRFLVGYLGERSQANWWPSEFLANQSEAFIDPVFQKTCLLAKLSGVTEAARRVHDERIGVGRVFHLFRLPETVEQRYFEFLQHLPLVSDIKNLPNSADTVLATLREIANKASFTEEGPVKAGKKSDFDRPGWVSKVASLYRDAFERSFQTFPYFTDEG